MTVTIADQRIIKADRDPTSADYQITLDGGNFILAETDLQWLNITSHDWFQCSSVTPGVSSVWDKKPTISEGSFVPVLTFGGLSTGITYSASGQQGLWTRIGSVVYINIFINLNSKGTAVGNAIITGLPFAARAGISPKGLDITKAFTGVTAGFDQMNGRVNAGESQVRLVETSNNIATGVQNVTDVLFSDTSIIQVDGFYFI